MTEPGANWMGMRLCGFREMRSSKDEYTRKPASTISSAATSYQLNGSVSSPEGGGTPMVDE